jgi:hypothetical protein
VADDPKIPGGLRAPPPWPAPAPPRAIGETYVIPAAETKHGINWRRRKTKYVEAAIVEFTQAEINAGRLNSLPDPDEFNQTKLTQEVNAVLQNHPAFSAFRERYAGANGHVEVRRQTVISLLRKLHEANS